MTFNKAKVLEDIQKYIQKGQIDKAIEEYEKVLRIDPKDFKLRQKLGDLYLRKGKKNEAINQYLNVADIYIKDGFYLKAIAIYRQILRTDPNKYDIYEKLADLYKKHGLIGDAITQLRTLADIQEKQKNLSEAISTWEKIISYDPDNVFYRGKIIEFYLKQGLSSRAAEKLQRTIDYLNSKGKVEEVEKLLAHFPGIIEEDKDLSLKIAVSLYENGKYNDAIAKLDELIKKNPKNSDLYSLKGYCYLNLGNYSLARSCFENAVKLKNDHIDAKKGLAKLFVKQKDFVSLIFVIEEIYKILKAKGDFDHLKSLLDSYFPYLPEEEKIINLYIDLAKTIKNQSLLIEHLRKLAKISIKDNDLTKAENIYREILNIDPYEESAVRFFEEKEMGKTKEPPKETKISTQDKILEEKEPTDITKEVEEVSFLLKYGLLKNAKDKLEELKSRFPDSPIVKEKWAEYFENTKDYEALRMVYGELINIYRSTEDLDKVSFYESKLSSLKKPEPKKTELIEEKSKTSTTAEPKIIEDIKEKSKLSTIEEPEVIEDIEEVEEIETESFQPNTDDLILEAQFKLKMNDLEGTRLLCNKVLEIEPDNQRAKEILLSIPKEEKVAAEEKKETEYFDLTTEIMKELESEPNIKYPFKDDAERMTFQSLFKDFKEKLSQQISKEDVETHYNLGIAYKEMGLYDDAIGEFLLTSEFEEKTYDSFIMVANCFVEKGELDKAILFYKRALQIENILEEKKAGIYFEMGSISEREKDYEKAYMYFKKALSLDLSLKIAQNKIDELLKKNPELSKVNEAEF